MTASAVWQLAWGVVLILVILVAASSARKAWAIGLLLILIPFQIVDTRYASSSVLMAYALAGVFVMNGQMKVRLLSALGLIVLAYFISLSQVSRDLVQVHLIYMFVFFSCLLVFLLAYNFARLVEDERTLVGILLAVNVLCVLYCVLQISAGPGEKFEPFGITAFQFNENRHVGDARLVGPFSNPGCTAGYFTLMILVCAVEQMYAEGRRRRLAQALIGFNLIGLVATGNRAGLLIMVAMFPILLYTYRRELGARRITQYLVGGFAVLAIASAVAITYTGFGRMYERLGQVAETDEAGVPTTRTKTWPVAIERIKQAPLLGEGPRFISPEDAENLQRLRTAYDPYPHSLYLHQLRTVGAIGLAALLWFFYQSWRVLYRSAHSEDTSDGYHSALLRLGLLLIIAFLVAQITLEFNRQGTMDYAQFVFALMGMFVGLSDRVRESAPVPLQSREPQSIHVARVPQGRSVVN